MPSSPLDLTGVATYEVFLRSTLDKIGVTPAGSRLLLQDVERNAGCKRRAVGPR